MSDYKNYQLRQLGLTKESFQAKKRCVKEMVSPTAKGVAIIGMGVRGSSTGGFPSGIDQTGIPSNTPTGRLGGYEPIPTAKDNSEVIDRTPTNPQINSANPITDNPETNQTPHAHQIQQATDQAPQTVTGASTDSDATLTLKSVLPKDQQTVDIDVAEGDKKPDAMNGEESMESEDKAKAGLQEGKHKTGCKCGFCANKGSFKKKDKSADDNVKKSFGKDEDEDDESPRKKFLKKSDDEGEDDEFKTWKSGYNNTDKKFGMDETFKRHLQLMKESLDKKTNNVCHHCKQQRPCQCDSKDDSDSKLLQNNSSEYKKKFGDGKKEVNHNLEETDDEKMDGQFVDRGQIQLQGGIEPDLASKIANYHWDVMREDGSDERGVYNFTTRGNKWCCSVGLFDGKPAILSVTTTPGRLQLLMGDEAYPSSPVNEVNYTKDKNGKDVIAVGAPGSQARWEVENPDECYKCKDKKSCECNKKVNETKYSVPFEKMRGLANLGGRRLGSDGLWENTVTSHVLKSTPNKEVIKIDESKLNSITEILSRKKTLTIKEAKLMELANRLSKKRG